MTALPRLAFLALAVLSLALLAGCGGEPAGPAPEEPYPEAYAGTPWGEAVNGLALAVEIPQMTYAEGEALSLTVRAKNVSGGPLKLPSFEDHMWYYRLRFESLDGGPAFDSANRENVDFDRAPDLTLGDGEVWTKEVPLTEHGRSLRVIENRKPGDDWDYRDHLPAGRWHAWLELGLPTADGYWSGTVRSNVLEIRIGEAP